MSALGGKARRIPTNRDWGSRPQWSPDGNELACVVRYESGTFAEIVSLQTGERRLVPLPGAEVTRRLDLPLFSALVRVRRPISPRRAT